MTSTEAKTSAKKQAPLIAYEIQTLTFADGWVNTWTYEDSEGDMQPETFPTREAAQAALDEYLHDLADDVALGNISGYDPEEFQVHPVALVTA
jgi:hypothetical protein